MCKSNMARNNRIDNLRCLGILLIILAHCEGPGLINNIRSFDVILLVFISAFLCKSTSYTSAHNFNAVAKKRAKRLLKPTYIFVFVFSIFLFVGYRILGKDELFGLREIINSFLLCEHSVGYVWVIKVFLINTLLFPFIAEYINKIGNSFIYIVLFSLEFMLYLALVHLYQILPESWLCWMLVNEWLITCLAYAFIAQEVAFFKANEKWEKFGWIFWLIIVVITTFKAGNFSPAAGKRPPNLQYIAWGLLVTELLLKIIPDKSCKFTKWVSKNSMEIYLVHPFIVMPLLFAKKTIFCEFDYFWIIMWFVTSLSSFIVVMLSQKVHQHIIIKSKL